MAGLSFILGGPKGDKGGDKPAGPPSPSSSSSDGGGGMEGARKDAARAVAKALGVENADLPSLDSALQAFVEACQDSGYSEKE